MYAREKRQYRLRYANPGILNDARSNETSKRTKVI